MHRQIYGGCKGAVERRVFYFRGWTPEKGKARGRPAHGKTFLKESIKGFEGRFPKSLILY